MRNYNKLFKGCFTYDVFTHVVPSIIYVSPNGISDGSTALKPIDFQSAIVSPKIIPGDTLILLDGIYNASYTLTIQGSVANDVYIRAEHCYQAIIDGSLTIGTGTGTLGWYIDIRGIRIYYSDTNRGSWITPQGSISRPASISVLGQHCNIINNIIHDGGVGITAYAAANNCVIYGNIVFNSGWADDTLGGAQNIYIHSLNKIVKHNIFAGAFKKTVAVYTTGGDINNITLEQNVVFERTSALVGGAHGEVIAATVDGNHIIERGLQCGYTENPNTAITVQNNIIYSKLGAGYSFAYFQNITALNNKIIAGSLSGGGYQGQAITIVEPALIVAWNFNNNEYHYTGALPLYFTNVEGVAHYSFPQWQALGYDAASTYDEILPVVNEIFVYPNDYAATECRKGFIVIWNWEGLNTVSVDLSTLGLVNGTTYRWRQAQDPLTDIGTFVYGGINVNFSMIGHTVALPIGFTEELITNQFPLFGCFIIESV